MYNSSGTRRGSSLSLSPTKLASGGGPNVPSSASYTPSSTTNIARNNANKRLSSRLSIIEASSHSLHLQKNSGSGAQAVGPSSSPLVSSPSTLTATKTLLKLNDFLQTHQSDSIAGRKISIHLHEKEAILANNVNTDVAGGPSSHASPTSLLHRLRRRSTEGGSSPTNNGNGNGGGVSPQEKGLLWGRPRGSSSMQGGVGTEGGGFYVRKRLSLFATKQGNTNNESPDGGAADETFFKSVKLEREREARQSQQIVKTDSLSVDDKLSAIYNSLSLEMKEQISTRRKTEEKAESKRKAQAFILRLQNAYDAQLLKALRQRFKGGDSDDDEDADEDLEGQDDANVNDDEHKKTRNRNYMRPIRSQRGSSSGGDVTDGTPTKRGKSSSAGTPTHKHNSTTINRKNKKRSIMAEFLAAEHGPSKRERDLHKAREDLLRKQAEDARKRSERILNGEADEADVLASLGGGSDLSPNNGSPNSNVSDAVLFAGLGPSKAEKIILQLLNATAGSMPTDSSSSTHHRGAHFAAATSANGAGNVNNSHTDSMGKSRGLLRGLSVASSTAGGGGMLLSALLDASTLSKLSDSESENNPSSNNNSRHEGARSDPRLLSLSDKSPAMMAKPTRSKTSENNTHKRRQKLIEEQSAALAALGPQHVDLLKNFNMKRLIEEEVDQMIFSPLSAIDKRIIELKFRIRERKEEAAARINDERLETEAMRRGVNLELLKDIKTAFEMSVEEFKAAKQAVEARAAMERYQREKEGAKGLVAKRFGNANYRVRGGVGGDNRVPFGSFGDLKASIRGEGETSQTLLRPRRAMSELINSSNSGVFNGIGGELPADDDALFNGPLMRIYDDEGHVTFVPRPTPKGGRGGDGGAGNNNNNNNNNGVGGADNDNNNNSTKGRANPPTTSLEDSLSTSLLLSSSQSQGSPRLLHSTSSNMRKLSSSMSSSTSAAKQKEVERKIALNKEKAQAGVDEDEFLALFSKSLCRGMTDEEVRHWFRTIDRDCSGSVQWAEISHYLITTEGDAARIASKNASNYFLEDTIENLVSNAAVNGGGGGAGAKAGGGGKKKNPLSGGADNADPFPKTKGSPIKTINRIANDYDTNGDHYFGAAAAPDRRHRSTICSLIYSKGADRLFSRAANDEIVMSWDPKQLTGMCIHKAPENLRITDMTYLPHNDKLMILQSDRSVFIYDAVRFRGQSILQLDRVFATDGRNTRISDSTSTSHYAPLETMLYGEKGAGGGPRLSGAGGSGIASTSKRRGGAGARGSAMSGMGIGGGGLSGADFTSACSAVFEKSLNGFMCCDHLGGGPSSLIEPVVFGLESGGIDLYNLTNSGLSTGFAPLKPFTSFSPHSQPVTRVMVAPELEGVITSSLDESIAVTDLTTGAVVQRMMLADNPRPLFDFAYTRNHNTLVTWGGRRLHLWNAMTGARLTTLNDHEAPVEAVAINSDMMHLYAVQSNKVVKVWDLRTWRALGQAEDRHFRYPSDTLGAALWSPEHQTLFTGCSDLFGWRPSDVQERIEAGLPPAQGTFLGNIVAIRDFKVLPEAGHTVTIDAQSVIVWGTPSEKILSTWRWEDGDDAATSISWSPDGVRMLVGTEHGQLSWYNYTNGVRFFDFMLGEPSRDDLIPKTLQSRFVLSGSDGSVVAMKKPHKSIFDSHHVTPEQQRREELGQAQRQMLATGGKRRVNVSDALRSSNKRFGGGARDGGGDLLGSNSVKAVTCTLVLTTVDPTVLVIIAGVQNCLYSWMDSKNATDLDQCHIPTSKYVHTPNDNVLSICQNDADRQLIASSWSPHTVLIMSYSLAPLLAVDTRMPAEKLFYAAPCLFAGSFPDGTLKFFLTHETMYDTRMLCSFQASVADEEPVTAVVFHHETDRIIVGDATGTVSVFKANKLLKAGHVKSEIIPALFRLSAGSTFEEVDALFDAVGNVELELAIDAHDEAIVSIHLGHPQPCEEKGISSNAENKSDAKTSAFSRLYTAGGDRFLRVWDMATKTQIGEYGSLYAEQNHVPVVFRKQKLGIRRKETAASITAKRRRYERELSKKEARGGGLPTSSSLTPKHLDSHWHTREVPHGEDPEEFLKKCRIAEDQMRGDEWTQYDDSTAQVVVLYDPNVTDQHEFLDEGLSLYGDERVLERRTTKALTFTTAASSAARPLTEKKAPSTTTETKAGAAKSLTTTTAGGRHRAPSFSHHGTAAGSPTSRSVGSHTAASSSSSPHSPQQPSNPTQQPISTVSVGDGTVDAQYSLSRTFTKHSVPTSVLEALKVQQNLATVSLPATSSGSFAFNSTNTAVGNMSLALGSPTAPPSSTAEESAAAAAAPPSGTLTANQSFFLGLSNSSMFVPNNGGTKDSQQLSSGSNAHLTASTNNNLGSNGNAAVMNNNTNNNNNNNASFAALSRADNMGESLRSAVSMVRQNRARGGGGGSSFGGLASVASAATAALQRARRKRRAQISQDGGSLAGDDDVIVVKDLSSVAKQGGGSSGVNTSENSNAVPSSGVGGENQSLERGDANDSTARLASANGDYNNGNHDAVVMTIIGKGKEGKIRGHHGQDDQISKSDAFFGASISLLLGDPSPIHPSSSSSPHNSTADRHHLSSAGGLGGGGSDYSHDAFHRGGDMNSDATQVADRGLATHLVVASPVLKSPRERGDGAMKNVSFALIPPIYYEAPPSSSQKSPINNAANIRRDHTDVESGGLRGIAFGRTAGPTHARRAQRDVAEEELVVGTVPTPSSAISLREKEETQQDTAPSLSDMIGLSNVVMSMALDPLSSFEGGEEEEDGELFHSPQRGEEGDGEIKVNDEGASSSELSAALKTKRAEENQNRSPRHQDENERDEKNEFKHLPPNPYPALLSEHRLKTPPLSRQGLGSGGGSRARPGSSSSFARASSSTLVATKGGEGSLHPTSAKETPREVERGPVAVPVDGGAVPPEPSSFSSHPPPRPPTPTADYHAMVRVPTPLADVSLMPKGRVSSATAATGGGGRPPRPVTPSAAAGMPVDSGTHVGLSRQRSIRVVTLSTDAEVNGGKQKGGENERRTNTDASRESTNWKHIFGGGRMVEVSAAEANGNNNDGEEEKEEEFSILAQQKKDLRRQRQAMSDRKRSSSTADGQSSQETTPTDKSDDTKCLLSKSGITKSSTQSDKDNIISFIAKAAKPLPNFPTPHVNTVNNTAAMVSSAATATSESIRSVGALGGGFSSIGSNAEESGAWGSSAASPSPLLSTSHSRSVLKKREAGGVHNAEQRNAKMTNASREQRSIASIGKTTDAIVTKRAITVVSIPRLSKIPDAEDLALIHGCGGLRQTTKSSANNNNDSTLANMDQSGFTASPTNKKRNGEGDDADDYDDDEVTQKANRRAPALPRAPSNRLLQSRASATENKMRKVLKKIRHKKAEARRKWRSLLLGGDGSDGADEGNKKTKQQRRGTATAAAKEKTNKKSKRRKPSAVSSLEDKRTLSSQFARSPTRQPEPKKASSGSFEPFVSISTSSSKDGVKRSAFSSGGGFEDEDDAAIADNLHLVETESSSSSSSSSSLSSSSITSSQSLGSSLSISFSSLGSLRSSSSSSSSSLSFTFARGGASDAQGRRSTMPQQQNMPPAGSLPRKSVSSLYFGSFDKRDKRLLAKLIQKEYEKEQRSVKAKGEGTETHINSSVMGKASHGKGLLSLLPPIALLELGIISGTTTASASGGDDPSTMANTKKALRKVNPALSTPRNKNNKFAAPSLALKRSNDKGAKSNINASTSSMPLISAVDEGEESGVFFFGNASGALSMPAQDVIAAAIAQRKAKEAKEAEKKKTLGLSFFASSRPKEEENLKSLMKKATREQEQDRHMAGYVTRLTHLGSPISLSRLVQKCNSRAAANVGGEKESIGAAEEHRTLVEAHLVSKDTTDSLQLPTPTSLRDVYPLISSTAKYESKLLATGDRTASPLSSDPNNAPDSSPHRIEGGQQHPAKSPHRKAKGFGRGVNAALSVELGWSGDGDLNVKGPLAAYRSHREREADAALFAEEDEDNKASSSGKSRRRDVDDSAHSETSSDDGEGEGGGKKAAAAMIASPAAAMYAEMRTAKAKREAEARALKSRLVLLKPSSALVVNATDLSTAPTRKVVKNPVNLPFVATKGTHAASAPLGSAPFLPHTSSPLVLPPIQNNMLLSSQDVGGEHSEKKKKTNSLLLASSNNNNNNNNEAKLTSTAATTATTSGEKRQIVADTAEGERERILEDNKVHDSFMANRPLATLMIRHSTTAHLPSFRKRSMASNARSMSTPLSENNTNDEQRGSEKETHEGTKLLSDEAHPSVDRREVKGQHSHQGVNNNETKADGTNVTGAKAPPITTAKGELTMLSNKQRTPRDDNNDNKNNDEESSTSLGSPRDQKRLERAKLRIVRKAADATINAIFDNQKNNINNNNSATIKNNNNNINNNNDNVNVVSDKTEYGAVLKGKGMSPKFIGLGTDSPPLDLAPPSTPTSGGAEVSRTSSNIAANNTNNQAGGGGGGGGGGAVYRTISNRRGEPKHRSGIIKGEKEDNTEQRRQGEEDKSLTKESSMSVKMMLSSKTKRKSFSFSSPFSTSNTNKRNTNATATAETTNMSFRNDSFISSSSSAAPPLPSSASPILRLSPEEIRRIQKQQRLEAEERAAEELRRTQEEVARREAEELEDEHRVKAMADMGWEERSKMRSDMLKGTLERDTKMLDIATARVLKLKPQLALEKTNIQESAVQVLLMEINQIRAQREARETKSEEQEKEGGGLVQTDGDGNATVKKSNINTKENGVKMRSAFASKGASSSSPSPSSTTKSILAPPPPSMTFPSGAMGEGEIAMGGFSPSLRRTHYPQSVVNPSSLSFAARYLAGSTLGGLRPLGEVGGSRTAVVGAGRTLGGGGLRSSSSRAAGDDALSGYESN